MPQPRFITSDSQMGAPGVYVKETAPASPVRGERRRVVGFAGQCVRGPVNKLVRCDSYRRFTDVFGGRDRNVGGGAVLGHVWSRLQGKYWGAFYAVRVASADAVAASFTVEDEGIATLALDPLTANITTVLRATSRGAGGEAITLAFVGDGSGVGSLVRTGNAFVFHFQAGTTTVANFEAAVAALSGAARLIEVQTPGASGTLATPGDVFAATAFGIADGTTTPVLRVDASSVGSWGNDLGWLVTPASSGVTTRFNLAIRLYGSVKVLEDLDVSAGQNNLALVVGDNDATLIRLTKLADGRPMNSVAGQNGADSQGYVNLGQTVAGRTSVVGSDGVVDDLDYTGLDGPMDLLNKVRGVHACAVVGRSSADIRSKARTLAAVAAQRVWFVCPDDENVTYDEAIEERAQLSGGRLSYQFNHALVTDAVTRENVYQEPFVTTMSIISQTDPDVHPGDLDNASLTSSVKDVRWILGDEERDALDKGGVTFLFRDQDPNGNDVVVLGNALTCDFSVNNRDLDGRYMKDFIIDALANRLRGDQFKGNTPANRADRAASCSGFLNSLAKTQRYVLTTEDGKAQFSYVNNSSVNSSQDQAQGDQREVCIVQLIPKNKRIQLNVSIGVDAVVSEQ